MKAWEAREADDPNNNWCTVCALDAEEVAMEASKASDDGSGCIPPKKRTIQVRKKGTEEIRTFEVHCKIWRKYTAYEIKSDKG